MVITTERLPRARVALSIEIDDERVEASMDRAVRSVSQRVRIPGFRPGKAPRHIVEQTVGRSALLQEVLDRLLPDIYSEALESEAIDAIGQPEIELKSMEPMVVHATVPVRPTVELGDYRALRAPRPDAEATPEQIEDTLIALRRRFATLEPVDRPVEWGDTVRADVTVLVEGQGEPHVEEDAEFRVQREAVVSLPGFLDHMVELERGGPYEFSFKLPDDFDAAELAGKTASYTVQLHEVKREVLPELDDEFALSLDEGFDTAQALRDHVDQDVRAHVEADALARYRDEIVDLLIAGADLDYPDVLVEAEIDRLVDQQSNHASHTPEELEQWLQRIGKSEEEVRAELRGIADLNARRSLVLGELVDIEQVEISEQRIDEELDLLVTQMLGGLGGSGGEEQGEQRDSLRGVLDTPDGRASISSRLLTAAALERLVEICSQPEEQEQEQAARGSRRRRGSRGAASGDATAADEAAADDAGSAGATAQAEDVEADEAADDADEADGAGTESESETETERDS